jgi:hypothetical protein
VKTKITSTREDCGGNVCLQSEYAAFLPTSRVATLFSQNNYFFFIYLFFAFTTLLARCKYRQNCKNKIDKELEKRKSGESEAFFYNGTLFTTLYYWPPLLAPSLVS